MSYFKAVVFKDIIRPIRHLSCIVSNPSAIVKHIAFDSRNVYDYNNTLFFNFSLHAKHLLNLYHKGCCNFVILEGTSLPSKISNANVIVVENVLNALQDLAYYHRQKFTLQTIGITGSNGKTIVKEWLYDMLEKKYNIVKTPQSFNSQIGVPISVWNINQNHNLGIFEAGISQKNEMLNLEKIIAPDIGIFTNLGEAHQENFLNKEDKLYEKLILFKHSKIVFYKQNRLVENWLKMNNPNVKHFTWGIDKGNHIEILDQKRNHHHCHLLILYQHKKHELVIPFLDNASIENSIFCVCVLLYLGMGMGYIKKALLGLSTIPMRLSISKGNHQCVLINDSYSNDMTALQVAIEYLIKKDDYLKKSLVLSAFQHPQDNKDISSLLNTLPINKIILIGSKFFKDKGLFKSSKTKKYYFFNSTQDFIKALDTISFKEEIILFKGARQYAFEKLINYFKANIHETTLEINLKNLEYNFKYIKGLLNKNTQIIAVIKAFAYGSGSVEIARILERKQVAYFAVAYLNEAIELRQKGIKTRIMVMNCNEKGFDFLIEYHLEPVIFCQDLLKQFVAYLSQKNIFNYPIHLKIDTGMNRVGFKEVDISGCLVELKKHKDYIAIQTIYTHLAGSEDPHLDHFTQEQFKTFMRITKQIKKHLGQDFKTHILNSGGILRHANMQSHYVRLGIALYGILPNVDVTIPLKNVLTLKTSIAQIKEIEKGETIGYNRKGKGSKITRIATIRIGYAEGYQRRFGNGVGRVLINNQLAQTIGSVCMDLTMVDVSHISDVQVGDPVIIFGNDLGITEVAGWAQTIPYELITTISPRVRREYVY